MSGQGTQTSLNQMEVPVKHMIRLMLVCSVIALLAVNTNAMGRDQGLDRGMKGPAMPLLNAPWDRIEDIGREIGLSAEQLDKIQAIRRSHREKVAPLEAERELRRDDLHEAMLARKQTDEKEIIKLVDRLNEIHGIIFKDSILASYQIRSLLTQEQSDALRSLRDDRREERREWREDRRERREERREERRRDRMTEDHPSENEPA